MTIFRVCHCVMGIMTCGQCVCETHYLILSQNDHIVCLLFLFCFCFVMCLVCLIVTMYVCGFYTYNIDTITSVAHEKEAKLMEIIIL